MLVVISGTKYSGVERVVDIFVDDFGFESLSQIDNHDLLLDYCTKNYTRNLVLGCNSLELYLKLEKRPFLIHLSLDGSLGLRLRNSGLNMDEFIKEVDNEEFKDEKIQLMERSHFKFKIINDDVTTLTKRLKDNIENQLRVLQSQDSLTLTNPPLRPDWDTYFMKLATLAASRSNCMKRRVGCVIVRECRVIATGYNGTPRHLTNCFHGGCPRCNDGDSKNLHTCLCLHAEENALLEAGRDRIGTNATLYCDTCPCLTCSVKIVQTGITEVVYSQSYRMDDASFKVLREAGIHVRQFSFREEPMLVFI
ncbi:Deoxycytidylate deaminase [Nakaseomyces bracarensis]|uniref:dCMP deaminase n=1 Tax=Nakaseomyces bracarensis TaxID=273131 RepID=A0ABR4NNC3_9SACH